MQEVRTRIWAMMTAGGLVLLAGGCAALKPVNAVPQAAATVSADILPPGDLTLIQAGCSIGQPLLAATTKPTAPAWVSGSAAYFVNYCNDLAAAPVGQVPATTTPTTASWLKTGLALLQAAALAASLL